MKRFILLSLFLIGCLCMNGFIAPPARIQKSDEAPIIALADNEKVFEAHIANLLNLNNVYGEDFTDNEALVNAAALNLRSYANEFGFIKNEIVTAYIKDIYDIDIEINDKINADMPKRDGYVYLIPRGYTAFSHEVLSITDNGDFLTVISIVSVNTHDSYSTVGTATTRLEKNANASFGYNIISSDIDFNAVSKVA